VNLGLTTSTPAVVRVNPTGDAMTWIPMVTG
jgi:hypothetical protein